MLIANTAAAVAAKAAISPYCPDKSALMLVTCITKKMPSAKCHTHVELHNRHIVMSQQQAAVAAIHSRPSQPDEARRSPART